jgi:hypothetical protein
LRSEPEYRDIIANAQKRMWTPFFEGLADHTFRRAWLGEMIV